MKKSTLTLINLALTLVNLVLTAIIVFTLIGPAQKQDEFLTKVAQLIDLDISGSGSTGGDTPGINDIEVIDVTSDGSTAAKITITVNDKTGKMHYVVVTGAITLNKKSKDYEAIRPSVDTNMKLIVSTVSSTVSKCAYENLLSQKEELAKQITTALQDLFKSDIIYNFTFVDYTIQ